MEGSAQNLFGSTDMTSGTWYGNCSASNDGTMALGVAMCKIAKTTSTSRIPLSVVVNGGASNLSPRLVCPCAFLLLQSPTAQASVGILGGIQRRWGLLANGAVTKISGPGTVAQDAGSLFASYIVHHSPTVVEIKRNLLVSELLYVAFYPDTLRQHHHRPRHLRRRRQPGGRLHLHQPHTHQRQHADAPGG